VCVEDGGRETCNVNAGRKIGSTIKKKNKYGKLAKRMKGTHQQRGEEVTRAKSFLTQRKRSKKLRKIPDLRQKKRKAIRSGK